MIIIYSIALVLCVALVWNGSENDSWIETGVGIFGLIMILLLMGTKS